MDGQNPRQRRSQRLIESSQKTFQAANGLGLPAQKDFACLILTLPNGILLEINAHLELPWQMSFALTCKHLKETICFQEALLRSEEKDLAVFLSTWLRNTPGKYSCFCYNQIRSLNPGHGWDGHDHEGAVGAFRNLYWENHGTTQLGHIVEFTKAHHACIKLHDIHFMKAYLVMNCQRYGANHGMPLESLEYSATLDQEMVLSSGPDGFRTMFVPRNEIFHSTMGLRPREGNG
jgi:hypothetical protein